MSQPNREDRYAEELFQQLDRNGCFVTARDKRTIRQAFERHFREVFKDLVAPPVNRKQNPPGLVVGNSGSTKTKALRKFVASNGGTPQ